MRAINIYALTRCMNGEFQGPFERALSGREEKLRIKGRELSQIREITEGFQKEGADPECYEDWFYSFTIPHISREFDLLKIGGNDCVVNVELKTASPTVTLARIKKQLERNVYHLLLIAKKIYSFTYVSDGEGAGQLYMLQGEQLKKCSFEDLVKKLKRIKKPVKDRVEDLFTPGDFLISPFSEPERFCKGQYFLTEHHQLIKEKIVSGIQRGSGTFWGITGAAGTGKTLLLYDVAKELAKKYRILVIHCGKLTQGHQRLREMLRDVEITEAGKPEMSVQYDGYDVVCMDETQRASEEELDALIGAYRRGKIRACLFVYDLKQVLTRSELYRNTPEKLRAQQGFTELRLAKTIRTGKEIYAFMNSMMDLRKRSNIAFRNIDILYADTRQETEQLIRFYGRKGYHYIALSGDEAYYPRPAGTAEDKLREDTDRPANAQDVIGLEFDNVLVVLDERFTYDERGVLQGTECPGEDDMYVQMLYQNVSRAKLKLCVIVSGNQNAFGKLIQIM